MNGYDFLTIMTYLVLGGLVVVGLQYLRQRWQDSLPERQHLATKQSLSTGQVDNEGVDPKSAAKQNLRFLRVPDVDAGEVLYNVPALDPTVEGKWEENQVVLTTSRINLLTKAGPRGMELLELSDGYAILATGSKVVLLKRYKMTQQEEDYLHQQRESAAHSPDSTIESFLGHEWAIKMAGGASFRPQDPPCSSIQVLSAHERLGSDFRSVLPPDLFDKASHDYFDLEATNTDGQVLVSIYAAGAWVCFIGRYMTDDQIDNMRG